MVKNDYRRALIMLRAHERGYSGHVRLEHRVMMGSMYFTVSAPSSEGTLCASLVRADAKGGYVAFRLGNLRRDGRGQGSFAYSFDPRNIGGRPLDDYFLIAIALQTGGECAIVLTGNVNGSRDFRYDGVRDAVCNACAAEAQPAAETEAPPAEAEIPADDLPEAAEEESASESGDASQESALQIAADAPWPGAAENLRALFLSGEAQELMLGDGYTYIRAPMPEDSGFDFVNIGVKIENGAPVGIAYAFPGSFAAEPPEGLEGYVWRGGAADGWWVLYTNPETGEAL